MLDNSKGFHQHARFSKETIGFYPNWSNLSLKQTIIRAWYFLWFILLFDTQLKQDLQIYPKFLSSSSYSCLPMKVCESEVYAKHIVQPLDSITYACFRKNLSLDTVAVTKICTKFLKVKIRSSYILSSGKDFIIHQLHKKSNYDHLK